MARKTVSLVLVLSAFGCGAPQVELPSAATAPTDSTTAEAAPKAIEQMEKSSWHTLPKEPSVLVFDDKDTVRTGLTDLRVLAELPGTAGQEWYLLSGRQANERVGKTSLFVLYSGDSSAVQAFLQPWHMPGRLIDAKGKECYYEAQVFAGEVLRDTIGVIWYDRSLMPDGTWRLNTTLLNLSGARPDTLVLFGHGRKSSTIDLAFHGKCRLLDSLDQRIDP